MGWVFTLHPGHLLKDILLLCRRQTDTVRGGEVESDSAGGETDEWVVENSREHTMIPDCRLSDRMMTIRR